MSRIPVVILGAGPAGLGAAYQLARRGNFDVTVLERAPIVGGNAASFTVAGIPVDYGSHRLHPSCAPEILADIQRMLGDDLLDRPRHGRIRLRGRWLHFPLKPIDLATSLPPSFGLGVARDAILKRFASPKREEESFATVLEQGLGRTICRDFYFPYAKKIWGVDPATLDAEQARRRVAAGSVGKMIRKVAGAIPGFKPKGQGRFYYPRKGFGQISQAYADAARAAGADIRLNASVTAVLRDNDAIAGVRLREADGDRTIETRHVFSTIPLPVLVQLLDPAAPSALINDARSLAYRAMMLVYLVLDTDQFTEFDAHYFPESAVAITRLSEPKNYGLTVKPGTTVLCAEWPCSPDDAIWHASDQMLGERVVEALRVAGLPVQCAVQQVEVRRLAQAYPIYTRHYRQYFDRLDAWVATLGGLVTLGRQGLFAHDNTHHTLAMAYAANECLGPDGTFDGTRWTVHRRAFESFVVED